MKSFCLTTMLVILAMKTSLVSIKKNLVSVSLTLYYTDQCTQGAVSIIPWFINVCIIYLHVIENCLKVTIAMFYFCHSKNPSNIMKNIFNSITIYSWKRNSLLTNMRNNYVARQINVYFLDVMKNGQIFSSRICHSQYDHRLSFSRDMGNIKTCKEIRLQKHRLNLDCQGSIRFDI